MESDNSKKSILRAALELFSVKGYDAVGVQEICDAAGITKPTLYYFFKSKQGLVEAIVDEWGVELLRSVKDAAVYQRDFIKGLTNILTAQIIFAKENPMFFRFHVGLLNAPNDSEARSVYAPVIKKLDSCIDSFFLQSAAEFGNMRGKEKLYALLFRNTVQTVAFQCVQRKLKSDDQMIFQIVHSFVYGVAS